MPEKYNPVQEAIMDLADAIEAEIEETAKDFEIPMGAEKMMKDQARQRIRGLYEQGDDTVRQAILRRYGVEMLRQLFSKERGNGRA